MIRRLVQYAFWAWCILLSGCTVWQNARRTLIHEPAAYSWKHDRRRSVDAYRQLADQIWQQEAIHCPELLGRPDYAMGFRDGFVDYVYAGGSGEPPPVPPRHFWNVALRGPDGKQRVDEWFAGYRHGARVARDGGYREFGRLNSSLFGIGPPPGAGYMPDAMGPLHLEPEAFWPHEGLEPEMEVLPEPSGAPALSPPAQTLESPSDRPNAPGPAAEAPPVEAELNANDPMDASGGDSLESESAPVERPPVDTPAAEPEANNPVSPDAQRREVPTRPSIVASKPKASDRTALETKRRVARSVSAIVPAEPAELPPMPAVRIPAPPTTVPLVIGAPKNDDARQSTLRFVSDAQGGLAEESTESQATTVVQTSFLVKTPKSATSDRDAKEVGQPPQQPNVEPPAPAQSTIRIREGKPGEVGSAPHPPAWSVRNPRKPSFVR